jgi:hypothetical protein
VRGIFILEEEQMKERNGSLFDTPEGESVIAEVVEATFTGDEEPTDELVLTLK